MAALRGFGLSLAEVGQVLDGRGADPRGLLQRQLAQVDERIEVAQRLRRMLLGVLAGLGGTAEPSELAELQRHRAALLPPGWGG
ncbi:MerR family DNA-binding protein [Planosporangium sp. 12N6]|uniref:MerR family DNA-binding protein n=1 Tax=Planosporangium spinosum TaxID=3402278 RepID=UPI003CF79E3F